MTQPGIIFTIGHSTHPQEYLIDLLRHYSITALCDVRSRPFSGWSQQFNRNELEDVLPRCGIEYRFLGKELGARSDDPNCYQSGRIQYDLLAKTELFRSGLKRVLNGVRRGFRVVLMCAEKEPLECHRTILIGRHLDLLGVEVKHIHADGQLEIHSDAISRLVRDLFPEDDLFLTSRELVELAYRRQGDRIAYVMNNEEDLRRRAAE